MYLKKITEIKNLKHEQEVYVDDTIFYKRGFKNYKGKAKIIKIDSKFIFLVIPELGHFIIQSDTEWNLCSYHNKYRYSND